MSSFKRNISKLGVLKNGMVSFKNLASNYPKNPFRSFYEKLNKYSKVERIIHNREFTFVVEDTYEGCFHACTIDDIVRVLEYIPLEDLGDIRLIIFRQPKRKEVMLSPVWGRLILAYDFEDQFQPAIVLDAVNYKNRYRWNKKLKIEDQKELIRQKQEGHDIQKSKKNKFETAYTIKNVRETQLHRTLLREIGHYLHYHNTIMHDAEEEETFEDWEARFNSYLALPKHKKMEFANAYAEKMKHKLIRKGVIPFDRIVYQKEMEAEGIDPKHFLKISEIAP